jgi:hypothetical protein
MNYVAARKIGRDRLGGSLSPHGLPTALDISHRFTPNRGGASSSVVRNISSNNTLGEGAALLKRASTTRTQTLLIVSIF